MEPDRYQQNHLLYIFGMISFLISMGLILFSLFTLPHLLFGARYDVPEFIAFWRQFLVSNYGLSEIHASLFVTLLFVLSGLLFGLGAYYASTRIDNMIYGINNKKKPAGMRLSSEIKESVHVFWKILALIALFYGVIFTFQWLLSVPFTFP